MEAEGAPPLGLLITAWLVIVAGIAAACSPVIYALAVIFGAY